MEKLNKAGEALGKVSGVTAMTDVTGFGLLGHLTEMCEGSGVSAEIYFDDIPLLTSDLKMYIDLHSIPGGTLRNWDSYGQKILFAENLNKEYATALLADPQTSGGLLVAADENAADEVQNLLQSFDLYNIPIGRTTEQKGMLIEVL